MKNTIICAGVLHHTLVVKSKAGIRFKKVKDLHDLLR